MRINRVGADENLAYAMTKPVDAGILEKYLEGIGCWIANGRHEDMPTLDDDGEEDAYGNAAREEREEEATEQWGNEVGEEQHEEEYAWHGNTEETNIYIYI